MLKQSMSLPTDYESASSLVAQCRPDWAGRFTRMVLANPEQDGLTFYGAKIVLEPQAAIFYVYDPAQDEKVTELCSKNSNVPSGFNNILYFRQLNDGNICFILVFKNKKPENDDISK